MRYSNCLFSAFSQRIPITSCNATHCYPQIWEFCTRVSHICIGEDRELRYDRYSQHRPNLFFYDEETHKVVGALRCDGTDGADGNNIDKNTLLKIVDNSQLEGAEYASFPFEVVKFKKGQTEDPDDDNSLWKIDYLNPTSPVTSYWNVGPLPGEATYNDDKCVWEETCPTATPTRSPTASPSSRPSAAP